MADPQDNLDIQKALADVLREQLELSRLNNDEIRDILNRTSLTTDQRRSILKLLRDTNKELSKNASLAEGLNDEFRTEKDIQKDINKSTELQNRLTLEAKQARSDGNKELAQSLINQAKLTRENKRQLTEEKNLAGEIAENFGLGGKALNMLNKATGGQLTGLNKVLETSRQQIGVETLKAKAAGKAFNSTKGAAIVAKNLGKNLLKGKNIYLLLLEATLRASNEVNRFQKELGVGYGKALQLRNEFTLAAAKSSDLFINSKKLQEAFFELKGAVGFVFDTSSRASETFLNLSKRLGFSAQEAGNLALLTRLQSKDTETVTSNLFKAADASAKLFGTTATAKDIIKSAATASKGLQASLAATPEILIKAAASAKAFGVELSALEATQKSLLNFEQSISAELEAELLTGRQLNLEKARLAALNNDLATVGEELKNQQIDLTSFGNMNYIQQEKIAEALGMSRDALGDALLKQELQNLTLSEINEKFGKQTYEQAKALAAQEKFNALTEKLMAIAGDIGVVLVPILDLAAQLIQLISPFLQLIGGIAGVLGSVVGGVVEGLGIDKLNRSIDGGFNNLTTVNDGILFNPEDKFSIVASTSPGALAQATSDIAGGGSMSKGDLDYLINGINNKKVVFDSFSSSGPQAFVNTERRRPSNLFF